MADFENQLNSILSNPDLMQKLCNMAGNFSAPTPPVQPQAAPSGSCSAGAAPFDPAALQSLMNLLQQTRLDSSQQNLLQALGSYLPSDRIRKLEKAMQAAKIAQFASSALGQSQGR